MDRTSDCTSKDGDDGFGGTDGVAIVAMLVAMPGGELLSTTASAALALGRTRAARWSPCRRMPAPLFADAGTARCCTLDASKAGDDPDPSSTCRCCSATAAAAAS